MPKQKNKVKKIKKLHLQILAVVLLILLAVSLVVVNNIRSVQAQSAMVAQVYFEGEYSVDGGPWKQIVKGEHIPATIKSRIIIQG